MNFVEFSTLPVGKKFQFRRISATNGQNFIFLIVLKKVEAFFYFIFSQSCYILKVMYNVFGKNHFVGRIHQFWKKVLEKVPLKNWRFIKQS